MKRQLNLHAVWRAAAVAAFLPAVVVVTLVISFATEGHTESTTSITGYPGAVLGSQTPEITRSSTPSRQEDPAPTLKAELEATPQPSTTATPAPMPTPAVLAVQAAPAPVTTDAPTPTQQQDRCPPYPILVHPTDDLFAASKGAMDMWARYLGCPVFEIADAGITVRYEEGWPGPCLDPDVAACAINGIFISPLSPLYDPQSVIAHELGHILNFQHAGGPGVMNPALWNGPETIWCEIDVRCN